MKIARLLLVVVALLFIAFYGYEYWSIDEHSLEKTAQSGVPAKFIKADEKTLKEVQERLKTLQDPPPQILEAPKRGSFGRSGLFFPDP